MVPPPTEPITDLEWERFVRIQRNLILGLDITAADAAWLETIAGPRWRLRRYPPRQIPYDELHPTIRGPYFMPYCYMAAVAQMENNGA
jgi:hypothetical protein